LEELKARSQEGTVEVSFLGGNFSLTTADDSEHQHERYIKSIKKLKQIVHESLEFDPVVLTGPNNNVGSETVSVVETQKRRVWIDRSKQPSEFDQAYQANMLDEEAKKWLEGGEKIYDETVNSNEVGDIENEEVENEKKVFEKGGEDEVSQREIIQKYLREYKKINELNEAHSRALKSLDSAREESFLTKGDATSLIEKLEEERISISKMIDESQAYMGRLFDQLTDESKERYLKP
jgi:hypothetical protein